jgi:HSP20 family protein
MRSRIQAVVLPSEVGEFADELRRVFSEFGRSSGAGVLAGECSPPLDVVETDEAIEVLVDLPGVQRDAVRILAKREMLLIAGEKTSHRGGADSTFHLVERGFGRFARVVRLGRSADPARAEAHLAEGVLRVRIPKLDDRRGQLIQIPVT